MTFNSCRNRRLGTSDPALASTGQTQREEGSSRSRLQPRSGGAAIRRRDGESCCSRQFIFDRLFTRPADQPRRATSPLSHPVDPSSPPIVKEPTTSRRVSCCEEDSSPHRLESVAGVCPQQIIRSVGVNLQEERRDFLPAPDGENEAALQRFDAGWRSLEEKIGNRGLPNRRLGVACRSPGNVRWKVGTESPVATSRLNRVFPNAGRSHGPGTLAP